MIFQCQRLFSRVLVLVPQETQVQRLIHEQLVLNPTVIVLAEDWLVFAAHKLSLLVMDQVDVRLSLEMTENSLRFIVDM
jgi:hypothetical protein